MTQDNSTEHLASSICDRICLNYEFYEEYLRDPEAALGRYVPVATERVAVSKLIDRKIDKARLETHWRNSIACACRDIAYEIPD